MIELLDYHSPKSQQHDFTPSTGAIATQEGPIAQHVQFPEFELLEGLANSQSTTHPVEHVKIVAKPLTDALSITRGQTFPNTLLHRDYTSKHKALESVQLAGCASMKNE